jgi:signal transduction histidine kinase
MSIVPRSIKTILTIDALLFICGLIGIYLISLKADLPFTTEYQNTTTTIKELMRDSTLSLADRKIISIDAKQFSSPEETETYLDGFRKGDKVSLIFSDQSQIKVKLVNYYSILYNILALTIGSSFFVIAILVLIKAKLQKPARIFHWVCVFTALIIMATWGYYNCQPRVMPMVIRSVLHFSVSIVPALFLHFTLVFPREKKGINKNWLRTLYILSAIIFLALSFNFFNLIFYTTIDNIKSYVASYNVSRIYLIVFVIAAIVVFIHSYRTTPSESDKKKLKWILYGLAIGPLGFILLWTLPIILTDEPLLPEEAILVLISVIPITFGISIVKYHLMDVDQVINRSIVYTLVIASLLIIYILIITLLASFAADIEPRTASIISALSVAVLFQPIRNKVQKFVDKKFFRLQYNFREAIRNIFTEINESSDTPSLAVKLIKGIDELLPVERIGFFLLNPVNNKLKLIAHKNFDLLFNHSIVFQRDKLKTNLPLPVALMDNIEPGVKVEIADTKVFIRWGMNLVFTLKSADQDILGFLVLGAKKSGTKFSVEDVDLLNAVVNRASASIDKIKLQEELFIERVESERLDELNRLKSYFISSISHDMKTPLTSIKMFTELLQTSGEINSEKSREYLEIIEGESSRLSRLIDNVLEFSKIESGIKRYRFENISLNEVVKHTIKLMQYQFKLQKFVIESNFADNEKFINADKDAVEDVLINLITNSLKYSKVNKSMRVNTFLQNDYMALSVEDEGIGISKQDIENIFIPFFRIDSKEVQSTGGAGLGLSIVKHIMDAHKGKIEVQSEPGRGSRFVLLFPVENLENK